MPTTPTLVTFDIDGWLDGIERDTRRRVEAREAAGPNEHEHLAGEPVFSAGRMLFHAGGWERLAREYEHLGEMQDAQRARENAARFRRLAAAGGAITDVQVAAVGPDGRPGHYTFRIRKDAP